MRDRPLGRVTRERPGPGDGASTSTSPLARFPTGQAPGPGLSRDSAQRYVG
jgi:hypothetical protein